MGEKADRSGEDKYEEQFEKARETALRALDVRARTVLEIRTRLTDRGFSDEITDAVLEDLLAVGYLDDRRFCEEYIRYALEKGRAARRIRRELAKKGISDNLFDDVCYELEDREDLVLSEEERKNAREIARRAAAGREPDDKLQGRVARRLSSLGYSQDIIWDTLRRLRDGRLDDDESDD